MHMHPPSTLLAPSEVMSACGRLHAHAYARASPCPCARAKDRYGGAHTVLGAACVVRTGDCMRAITSEGPGDAPARDAPSEAPGCLIRKPAVWVATVPLLAPPLRETLMPHNWQLSLLTPLIHHISRVQYRHSVHSP